MKSTIYLTRHGETIWNLEKRLQGWGDSKLTENGIKNAKNLNKRIKDVNIDVIYSSSSKRAMKTSEIIRGDKNIPIIPKDGLREMGFGEWEGLIWEDIEKSDEYSEELYNLYNEPLKYKPFGGESIVEFSKRTIETIKEIISKSDGKDILILTHGMTLKLVLGFFEGISPEEAIKGPIMGQTSLTKIVMEEGKYSIELRNDTTHYEEDYERKGW
ncbi:histidine phosphatase family protein [Clostridium sp. 'White wine YQ']|uniref:histidine phosphatase family protein n=1 Tax=Clostridium sp. 'White wine YQ' TaxID=3027474 RepID=UPI0023662684|nr:histidine phosphatase family protein [Clostridium sp. 'White wine YQ']MDD7796296.1 histidine phosphatase family protein [Clostridium sp. 'White wine YQ']